MITVQTSKSVTITPEFAQNQNVGDTFEINTELDDKFIQHCTLSLRSIILETHVKAAWLNPVYRKYPGSLKWYVLNDILTVPL